MTIGLTDSFDVLDDRDALRERAQSDGYLFLRGLLPREEVTALRADILKICANHGYLKDGGSEGEGLINKAVVDVIDPVAIAFCGVGIPAEAYKEVQRLESFHRLAHNPNLLRLYRTLFGGEVLVHPRHIARVMLPTGANAPTPPHQDFIHIQGTKNVWTSWIPIGDVPRELGGLSVLAGSNRDGLLPVKAAEGAGSLETYLCEVDYEWVEHDYEAGDVLTFSSLTVHRSIPNQLGDRLRISVDYRFQPLDEEVDRGSLTPHCGVLSWDEIYEGWESESIKYYWKKYDLSFSEWDESIRWQKEKIC